MTPFPLPRFKVGRFVTLTNIKHSAGRHGCVVKYTPNSQWPYIVSLTPTKDDQGMMTQFNVREDQLIAYDPDKGPTT